MCKRSFKKMLKKMPGNKRAYLEINGHIGLISGFSYPKPFPKEKETKREGVNGKIRSAYSHCEVRSNLILFATLPSTDCGVSLRYARNDEVGLR